MIGPTDGDSVGFKVGVISGGLDGVTVVLWIGSFVGNYGDFVMGELGGLVAGTGHGNGGGENRATVGLLRDLPKSWVLVVLSEQQSVAR
jgi:hypothetical protein